MGTFERLKCAAQMLIDREQWAREASADFRFADADEQRAKSTREMGLLYADHEFKALVEQIAIDVHDRRSTLAHALAEFNAVHGPSALTVHVARQVMALLKLWKGGAK